MTTRENVLEILRLMRDSANDDHARAKCQKVIDEIQPSFASPGGCSDRVMMSVQRKETN